MSRTYAASLSIPPGKQPVIDGVLFVSGGLSLAEADALVRELRDSQPGSLLRSQGGNDGS
jgi:hypothetical protein